jgi:hypothetical protein
VMNSTILGAIILLMGLVGGGLIGSLFDKE